MVISSIPSVLRYQFLVPYYTNGSPKVSDYPTINIEDNTRYRNIGMGFPNN